MLEAFAAAENRMNQQEACAEELKRKEHELEKDSDSNEKRKKLEAEVEELQDKYFEAEDYQYLEYTETLQSVKRFRLWF